MGLTWYTVSSKLTNRARRCRCPWGHPSGDILAGRTKSATNAAINEHPMLTKRIIPCLDVDAGRVVKGTSFIDLRDAGDPAELAARYNLEGGDELVFLDITASFDSRDTMVEVMERVSEQVFIPLTVGGGIRSVDDIRRMLHAGADKVSLNTAAVNDPSLIS